jgi:hypothetical protein
VRVTQFRAHSKNLAIFRRLEERLPFGQRGEQFAEFAANSKEGVMEVNERLRFSG